MMHLTAETGDLQTEITMLVKTARDQRAMEAMRKINEEIAREKLLLTQLAGILRADSPIWGENLIPENGPPGPDQGTMIHHPTLTIAGIRFEAMVSGEVAVYIPCPGGKVQHFGKINVQSADREWLLKALAAILDNANCYGECPPE